jgi:hypothetical protein
MLLGLHRAMFSRLAEMQVVIWSPVLPLLSTFASSWAWMNPPKLQAFGMFCAVSDTLCVETVKMSCFFLACSAAAKHAGVRCAPRRRTE